MAFYKLNEAADQDLEHLYEYGILTFEEHYSHLF
jgi:plasmid stabilization system protein ParE